jgi:ferredoxin-fold anticodon binding domain-containing protein
MFRIQVFSTDVDESVVEEALNITHNQSRKVRARLSLKLTS